MAGIARRMLKAALLDVDTYEEVEADRGANLQALAVVVLAALSAGIGSIANSGYAGIVFIAVAALIGWWVWAYATYIIGTRLLPGAKTVADHGELLRTIGFSSAPGTLFALGAIPAIAGFVFPLVSLWMLVAMVIAVRQALDYEHRGGTGRAIAVCAIGFPIYAAFMMVALLILGPWPI
jgi:hypothetical protein